MALQTKIETKSGLNLPAAILIITSVADNKSQSHHIQITQQPTKPSIFKRNKNKTRSRQTSYQVSIYASEKHLNDGQLTVGVLPADIGFNHKFEVDDKSKLSLEKQAYKDLMQQFPKAKEVDISEMIVN